MRFIGLLVIVWLIGARSQPASAGFHPRDANCASAGTIAVTVIAGPLNYFGANPKVTNCHVPQPS